MKFWAIEEAGGLVRLDKRNLPDLDDLMLDVLMTPNVRDNLLEQWEDQQLDGEDAATRIPGTDPWWRGEALVGYYRTNPCHCGEEHNFDMDTVTMDDDGNPVGTAARGAFMGILFR